MNIGFDAKRYFFNKTGLGNYSRNVVAHLASLRPNDRFLLYSKPISKNIFRADMSPNVKLREVNSIAALRRLLSYNDFWRKDDIAVYHGLSNELPLFASSKVKTVVTIHDLLYMDFPKDYGFIDRHIYNIKTYRAAQKADAVIAISRATKEALIQDLRVDENKIFVLYQDCDPLFYTRQSQLSLNGIRQRYDLPENYILSVGSFVKRKNHINLLKAFKRCSFEQDVKLILVGGGYMKNELETFVVDHGLKDKVIFLRVDGTKDLVGVYQSSLGSVYPSLKEGFGIPVLESLASGVPVAATGSGSTREAGGQHAYYFNPESVDSIAEAVQLMVKNKTIPNSNNLSQHFECFDATANARVLMGIYQNLLS